MNKMKKASLLALIVLATLCHAPSLALGQIEIPEINSPYEPIVASIAFEPVEGAELKTKWMASSGAVVVPVDNSAHVWAKPGKHTITASVVVNIYEEAGSDEEPCKKLVRQDHQLFQAKFIVAADDEPGPAPGPGPAPDGSFKGKLRAAIAEIGSLPGKGKVANIYAGLSAQAAANPRVYTPALMVDEAKQRVVTELGVSELREWEPFWDALSDAFEGEGLGASSDLEDFIEAFSDVADVLEE